MMRPPISSMHTIVAFPSSRIKMHLLRAYDDAALTLAVHAQSEPPAAGLPEPTGHFAQRQTFRTPRQYFRLTFPVHTILTTSASSQTILSFNLRDALLRHTKLSSNLLKG